MYTPKNGLRTFNNKLSTWLYYLLNDGICSPVHELLLGKTNPAYQDEYADDKIKNIGGSDFTKNPLYQLVYMGLLEHVVEIQPDSCICDFHGYKAIHQMNTGKGRYPYVVFLNAKGRDKFLLETGEIEVHHEGESYIIDKCPTQNKNGSTKLLYGRDIKFKYKEHFFKWLNIAGQEEIDLRDNENQPLSINGKVLRFSVKDYYNADEKCYDAGKICTELDNLIEEYESQKSTPTENKD